MKSAKQPKNEEERLRELRELKILDTDPERFLDEITQLASELCEAPIALISLIDENRQWFKSKVGLEVNETPRDIAFCAHAILEEKVFLVPDSREDDRFQDNPLVTDFPNVVFYAGAPLITESGHAIGTLCVIDQKPRHLSKMQMRILKKLSSQVVDHLELQHKLKNMRKLSKILDEIHHVNTASSDPVTLFNDFLSKGCEALDLELGIFSKVESDTYTVQEVVGSLGKEMKGAKYELESTYCQEVVSAKKTIFYNDVSKDPRMCSHPVYLHMKLASFIGTPVYHKGKLYGTLNYSSTQARSISFSEDEIRFIEIQARLISSKLEHWEMVKQNAKILSTEEKLELAVSSVNLGLWEWDAIKDTIEWNAPLYKLHGLSLNEELSLTKWMSTLAIDDRMVLERIFDPANEVIEFSETLRITSADDTKYLRILGKRIFDESKKMEKIIGVAWDETKDKHQSRLLEESFNRFRTLSDFAPAGIFLTDAEGRATYVNPYWTKLTGLSAEEAKGDGWSDAIHDEDKGSVFTEWKEAAKKNITFEKEFRFHHRKSGKISTVMARARALLSETGEIVGYLGTNIDITDQKKTENELKAAISQAEEASNAKSQFLANMSHEIRTPLNSIIGLSGLLMESELGEEQRSHANIIQNSSEVLLNIVNDILDLSKIEAQAVALSNTRFDLKQVIESLSNLFTWQAKSKGLEFKVKCDPGILQHVEGDRMKLSQVLINLLGNAFKFTDSGSITLSIEKNTYSFPGNFLISVQDTGKGIPKETQGKIFEAFSQGEQMLEKKIGGTGLGLTITKKLVGIMGGEIWVKSSNEGSLFQFTLNLKEVETVTKPVSVLEELPHLGMDRPLRVLLVDDAINNRKLIQAYLKGYPFIVKEAVNGEEALSFMKDEIFDLVLMDIQMPLMDGYTATAKFREWELLGKKQRTKIIALTAFAMEEEKAKCLEAGCDLHLAKPLRKQALLGAMSKILAKSA